MCWCAESNTRSQAISFSKGIKFSMYCKTFTGLLALGLFFSSCFDGIPEPHSVNYDDSFGALAVSILGQEAIFEMDDFTRHHKSINGIFIVTGERPTPLDSLAVEATSRRYQSLQFVLDSFHIPRDLFNEFRERLEETRLRAFYKSGDSILFTVDGFLDGSWGFMYSKKPLSSAPEPFRFGGNTVTLLDSVKPNWRRVAIN